jgi:hypothetical protein
MTNDAPALLAPCPHCGSLVLCDCAKRAPSAADVDAELLHMFATQCATIATLIRQRDEARLEAERLRRVVAWFERGGPRPFLTRDGQWSFVRSYTVGLSSHDEFQRFSAWVFKQQGAGTTWPTFLDAVTAALDAVEGGGDGR